ncbi:MAG: cytochrome b/b6 domain-containing protein [Thermoanaerobaculia bacterium]
MSFNFRRFLVCLTVMLVAAAAGAQMSNDDCLGCHSDATAVKDLGNGKTKSVHVDPAKYGASVHSSFGCADCHADITDYPHPEQIQKVDCANCHPDAVTAWTSGRHAKAFTSGNRLAAGCLSCHGGNAHTILPQTDPKSPTNHANVPTTCGTCHSQKFVMEGSGLSSQPVFSYTESVHGRALAAGEQKAAACTDCHKAHDVLTANDPKSPIFKFNIPATCGQCHDKVSKEFMTSVHGKAVARGSSQAPVCTDCHGIHSIKSHIDPASSVATQSLSRTACGQCHGNVRMSKELGISSGRVKSYEQSYHGLASRLGSSEAANCASCHGVHNILAGSDPKSTIHKNNLSETCGKCHPGSTQKFVEGRIHLEEMPVGEQELGDKVRKWVSWIYIPLILLTLGGMALHNLIIWLKKVRRARKDPTRTVVRMNKVQRIQHFLLVTSFFLLVVTGFALAWPSSWLAAITGAEAIRRLIHRGAAVVMIALGLYHVWYMVFTSEGRKGLKDFWFSFRDAGDVVGVMKYNLGLSKEHPKMGRFTYAEKAEYWALVWGTIVMAVTGLMLWFEIEVSKSLGLPRWFVDVALLIHFYEAILATLAIIIWHLYAVLFDPDVYPMNWAWFDGKMREGQYRHEHEAHFDEMKRRGHDENDSTV